MLELFAAGDDGQQETPSADATSAETDATPEENEPSTASKVASHVANALGYKAGQMLVGAAGRMLFSSNPADVVSEDDALAAAALAKKGALASSKNAAMVAEESSRQFGAGTFHSQ